MAKLNSPLVGYNNNVRHKNRVFHIQTEDSGVERPHIITHLFVDGGRILKSTKTSYAEHVGADDLRDTVRRLMKEQHKAMFIALRDGQFDAMLEPSPAASSGDIAPISSSESIEMPSSGDIPAAAPAEPEPPPVRTASAEHPAEPPNISDEIPIPRLSISPRPANADGPPTQRDLNSLDEEDEATMRMRAVAQQTGHLPPPPKGVLHRPVEGGRYSLKPGAASGRPGEGRYAQTQQAAIFGPSHNRKKGSIFGEELISDKSLDEVILSYLAEDLG